MKRKRIYYIPGLISLLGIPILLLFLPPEDKIKETCIKFLLPSDNKPEENIIFSKYLVYKEIEKKKVVSVSLDDYFIGDESGKYRHYAKFDFMHKEIEKLQFTNDTASVFKIELGDENTYGEFVWIINECMLYNYKRYVFMDNSFYLFPNPPASRTIQQEFFYTSPSPAISIPHLHWITGWDIFKMKLKYKIEEAVLMIKRSYLLVTGFVLLILIPFFVNIRRKPVTLLAKLQ